MQDRLEEIMAFCLSTVSKGQLENGEFKTFLFFPGKAENGWIYAGPSVFLTSSIAISLCKNNQAIAKEICIKAGKYVKSQMEKGGLWRFYPHHGLFKFNTPMDIDDTSLASYLLTKVGIEFPNNKKIMYKQISRRGDFYIWYLPRLVFVANPLLFLRFVFDLRYSFPIFFSLKGRTEAALINYNDTEHAVNANAILYLGETPQTQKVINHLVEDLLFGNAHNQFFYPSILFTYYHVSRIYDDMQASQIENLKSKVENYFATQFQIQESNIQDKAIALLTLLNFKINASLITKIVVDINSSTFEDLSKPYAYFCTKDRNMVGGSVEFTCSIVSEALRKYKEQ